MRDPKACRSGDGCAREATAGRWGQFCPEHARQLGAIDITAPVRASARARAREEKAKRTSAGESKPPDPLGRLPIRQRAATLARHVHASDHPVSQAEAASALGLNSVSGSLPRILRFARDLDWIAPSYGRGTAGGYRPGSEAPPAEPEAP
jgi:hypothetical protein